MYDLDKCSGNAVDVDIEGLLHHLAHNGSSTLLYLARLFLPHLRIIPIHQLHKLPPRIRPGSDPLGKLVALHHLIGRLTDVVVEPTSRTSSSPPGRS